MPCEREIGICQQDRINRAERVDPADPAQVVIVAFRDDRDVVLGFSEGGHAAILEHPTGPGVIGGQRVDDIAIEGVELRREIARAAMHLQIGAAEVFRVDAQIACRARHDLGETIGADGGPRIDGEAAFLPDQCLKERAPLDGRETCAGHTGKAAGLLGHADDELLDIFRRVPEHLRTAGIGVNLGIAINGVCYG